MVEYSAGYLKNVRDRLTQLDAGLTDMGRRAVEILEPRFEKVTTRYGADTKPEPEGGPVAATSPRAA
ncbi:hypothetical protein GCM10007301_44340 [Azorhizobium oxalatiphilum]|uniref:Uncharacterized protein n=1 Tax=Azorhizobium oxalatiphilum TaxID=980631 RepID=A0A917C9C1_9HYPH|nr:hypothetical protein [Azorhizobium oxalatiphilum]GGF79441.1 hypothetical protein GCM10007301_44340 [Azorhizobium oxalatiphilum]